MVFETSHISPWIIEQKSIQEQWESPEKELERQKILVTALAKLEEEFLNDDIVWLWLSPDSPLPKVNEEINKTVWATQVDVFSNLQETLTEENSWTETKENTKTNIENETEKGINDWLNLETINVKEQLKSNKELIVWLHKAISTSVFTYEFALKGLTEKGIDAKRKWELEEILIANAKIVYEKTIKLFVENVGYEQYFNMEKLDKRKIDKNDPQYVKLIQDLRDQRVFAIMMEEYGKYIKNETDEAKIRAWFSEEDTKDPDIGEFELSQDRFEQEQEAIMKLRTIPKYAKLTEVENKIKAYDNNFVESIKQLKLPSGKTNTFYPIENYKKHIKAYEAILKDNEYKVTTLEIQKEYPWKDYASVVSKIVEFQKKHIAWTKLTPSEVQELTENIMIYWRYQDARNWVLKKYIDKKRIYEWWHEDILTVVDGIKKIPNAVTEQDLQLVSNYFQDIKHIMKGDITKMQAVWESMSEFILLEVEYKKKWINTDKYIAFLNDKKYQSDIKGHFTNYKAMTDIYWRIYGGRLANTDLNRRMSEKIIPATHQHVADKEMDQLIKDADAAVRKEMDPVWYAMRSFGEWAVNGFSRATIGLWWDLAFWTESFFLSDEQIQIEHDKLKQFKEWRTIGQSTQEKEGPLDQNGNWNMNRSNTPNILWNAVGDFMSYLAWVKALSSAWMKALPATAVVWLSRNITRKREEVAPLVASGELTKTEGHSYALALGSAMTVPELIFRNEAALVDFSMPIAKEATKKASFDAFKSIVRSGMKEVWKEVFEENLVNYIESYGNYAANSLLDTNFKQEVTRDEILTTTLITTFTVGLIHWVKAPIMNMKLNEMKAKSEVYRTRVDSLIKDFQDQLQKARSENNETDIKNLENLVKWLQNLQQLLSQSLTMDIVGANVLKSAEGYWAESMLATQEMISRMTLEQKIIFLKSEFWLEFNPEQQNAIQEAHEAEVGEGYARIKAKYIILENAGIDPIRINTLLRFNFCGKYDKKNSSPIEREISKNDLYAIENTEKLITISDKFGPLEGSDVYNGIYKETPKGNITIYNKIVRFQNSTIGHVNFQKQGNVVRIVSFLTVQSKAKLRNVWWPIRSRYMNTMVTKSDNTQILDSADYLLLKDCIAYIKYNYPTAKIDTSVIVDEGVVDLEVIDAVLQDLGAKKVTDGRHYKFENGEILEENEKIVFSYFEQIDARTSDLQEKAEAEGLSAEEKEEWNRIESDLKELLWDEKFTLNGVTATGVNLYDRYKFRNLPPYEQVANIVRSIHNPLFIDQLRRRNIGIHNIMGYGNSGIVFDAWDNKIYKFSWKEENITAMKKEAEMHDKFFLAKKEMQSKWEWPEWLEIPEIHFIPNASNGYLYAMEKVNGYNGEHIMLINKYKDKLWLPDAKVETIKASKFANYSIEDLKTYLLINHWVRVNTSREKWALTNRIEEVLLAIWGVEREKEFYVTMDLLKERYWLIHWDLYDRNTVIDWDKVYLIDYWMAGQNN